MGMKCYVLLSNNPPNLKDMGRTTRAFYDVVIPYAKQHNIVYERVLCSAYLNDEDLVVLTILLPAGMSFREY